MFSNSSHRLSGVDLQKVRAIGQPDNFFAGLPEPSVPVPRNVLLFCKQTFDHLPKPVSHHRHMLIFNFQTAATLLLDKLLIRLEPNHVLLVFPFQLHRFAGSDAERCTWLYVTFEMPDSETLAGLRNTPFLLPGDLRPFVLRTVEEYGHARKPQESSSNSIPYLISFVLAQMAARQQEMASMTPLVPPSFPAGHHLVQKACRYMAAHLPETIKFSRVADELSVSEGYLRNCFREAIGMGPAAYLRRMRLCHACALLKTSESNITEIAGACGLPSLYVFSRAFKHEMGTSPSNFRRQGRNAAG